MQQMVEIEKNRLEELEKAAARVSVLEHELNQLRRMIFGAKSERFVPTSVPGRPTLFDAEQSAEKTEAETEQIAYERKKPAPQKPVRLELPANLPRKQEIIEPEGLPVGAVKIGDEVTEVLEYTPPTLYVRQIVRPKYSLGKDRGVAIADLPSLPVPKGNAGPSLLASIIVSKFVDHLPFYRQIAQFKRQGVKVPESTMHGWFRQAADLLEPLYHELRKQLLLSHYLQADETPLKVLDSDKPGATHRGYMWDYHSPPDRLVCFEYRPTRSGLNPESFLKNFSGTLQTDGFSGYDRFAGRNGIRMTGCMAHARRKFEQAKDNDRQRAEHVLALMALLYGIEAEAREQQLTPEQRHLLRTEKAAPVMDRLREWLMENRHAVLPKSPIGTAINYTINMWPRLEEYLNDGISEIDNNLIENTIRPLALGRKNYLFAGSHEAAQRIAVIYSLLGTCRLRGVEPLQWLTQTLSVIADTKQSELHTLLPKALT